MHSGCRLINYAAVPYRLCERIVRYFLKEPIRRASTCTCTRTTGSARTCAANGSAADGGTTDGGTANGSAPNGHESDGNDGNARNADDAADANDAANADDAADAAKKVELGRTSKSISDILDFSPGTIIELDKIAGEPIDVLVNGKFVAKGEVVVIEESFGVRVTEIIK